MSRWSSLAAALLAAALTACGGSSPSGAPPDTTVVGPGGTTGYSGASNATFLLQGSGGAVAYRCTVDGAPVACSGSYVTVTGLAPGPHTFTAAAVDASGQVDPTPAVWTWTLDPALPPPPTFSATASDDQIVVTHTAPPDGGAIIHFGPTAATATAHMIYSTGSPMTLVIGFPGPDGQPAPIKPCTEYWVTVAAFDAAMHVSDPAAPQRVVTTPVAPGASVFGRDGTIVVGTPADGVEYQVEYGAAPDRLDGTEALEGASPLVVAAGQSLHGFPAGQARWFRVSRRYGPTCVGAADPVQRATPNPWRPLNSGPTATLLTAVACSNATSCLAAGANGVAFVTADGTSWSPATFSDDTVREAAASPTALFAHGYDGVLHRSTDGGATWSRRGPLDASGVAFLTADVGVAANMFGVYRTVDGGLSWTRRYPYAAYAVAAVPGGTRALAVTLEGAVLASADAGATWSPVLSTAESLETVTCASATRCLVSGAYGLLLVSDDAGATWSPRATGLAGAIVSMAFGDDLAGLALVNINGSRFVHRTVDGGSTWEPVAMEPAEAIAAAGPGSALVVGVAGLLARTDDGGATFVQVGDRHLVPGAGAVRAVSPGVILAAGTAGARRSADGGATWSDVAYPATVEWAASSQLRFVSDSFGMMPAIERDTGALRLLRTRDGGATWSFEGSGTLPGKVRDLACLANAGEPTTVICHAVLVTPDGTGLYRTLDGGASWEPVPGAGQSVGMVRFLDPMHGFMTSGGSNRVRATADGGATWTELTVWSGTLVVSPPATVWSISNAGTSTSVDGGATWSWSLQEWPTAWMHLTIGAGLRVSYDTSTFAVAPLTPGAPAYRDGAFPWEGPMVDLALADAQHWFAIDMNGVIWETTTAGR